MPRPRVLAFEFGLVVFRVPDCLNCLDLANASVLQAVRPAVVLLGAVEDAEFGGIGAQLLGQFIDNTFDRKGNVCSAGGRGRLRCGAG